MAWILGRLAGLAILLGASWLVYDGATSSSFHVQRIRIVGNRLVTSAEVEAASDAVGKNVFWLRPEEVASRIKVLPAVAAASVEMRLPDLVEVRVRERVPFAVWHSGGASFLVDEDGVIMASESAPSGLPVVYDVSSQAVRPGGRVDADALKAASLLDRMLSQNISASAPRFEFQPGLGIEVADLLGWRVRFGSSQDLDWKLSALQAIRRQLAEANLTASFVDLRFKGRPYYR